MKATKEFKEQALNHAKKLSEHCKKRSEHYKKRSEFYKKRSEYYDYYIRLMEVEK